MVEAQEFMVIFLIIFLVTHYPVNLGLSTHLHSCRDSLAQ